MKKSLEFKLEQMLERFQEVSRLLSEASVIANHDEFKALSKEYAHLEPVANCYNLYLETKENASSLQELIDGNDKELVEMANEEIDAANLAVEKLDEELQWHLIPKDKDDERNIYLEVRAGTGGDEAAIFAGDLFRMYSRYAETQGWQLELVSANHGEHGGEGLRAFGGLQHAGDGRSADPRLPCAWPLQDQGQQEAQLYVARGTGKPGA